jgi:hypothetical protein
LHFAHEVDVAVEELAHQLLQLAVLAKAKAVERPAKVHEGHLVARSVVDAHVRPPRLCDVPIKFVLGTADALGQQLVEERAGLLVCLLEPILEGAVAVAHRLLDGWGFRQQALQSLEVGREDIELGGVGRVGDLLGGDGLSGNCDTFCRSARKSRYSWWMGRCWYSVTSLNSMMRFAVALNSTFSQCLS